VVPRDRRTQAAALATITMLAILWAGPPASAGVFLAQSRAAASASPARVKFYVVPSASSGHAESLFMIAARTLGSGSRFMEIFNLNKGRLQPRGGRLENPHEIFPGWILQLPAGASGPGVRFGQLPAVSARPTSPASRRPSRPSRPVAGGASAAGSPAGWASTGIVIVAALAFAGLAVGLSRRRRAAGTVRRRPSHARTPGPRAKARGGTPATTAPEIRVAHPPWPAADPPGWPAELHHDQHSPAASLSAMPLGRDPGGHGGPSGAPAASPAGRPQLWPARLAPARASATQTHAEAALGDDRIGTLLTKAPAARPEGVTGPGARGREVLQLLAEEAADDQAAGITQQAASHAAAIRAAAERESAEMTRQAASQAAAIRAAAEQEAAELRAAVMTMSAELSRVATSVAENLATPAMPATEPAGRPADRAAAMPSDRPATKPDARPGTSRAGTKRPGRPATRPADLPAIKPAGQPRQYAAMRLTRLAVAAMFLLAVIAGTTEIALHGYSFFVFRSAGTGSTPGSGLKEDQGPGQPDAPRTHRQLTGHRP